MTISMESRNVHGLSVRNSGVLCNAKPTVSRVANVFVIGWEHAGTVGTLMLDPQEMGDLLTVLQDSIGKAPTR
jgi:hypothetical protein